MPVSCVLLDIEGTILPITFVRDILFPYAKQRLATFLRERREDPLVRDYVSLCQDSIMREEGTRPSTEQLAPILERWIAEDRKHPGLKAIQGIIWEDGYRTGAFAPNLYEDVAPALRRWHRNGLRLALYSSGSEQAQRLLVEHTNEGNLVQLFSHFFDTRIGAKTETSSYQRIAGQIGLPPQAILFLSDVEAELNAAAAAYLSTMQVIRPGTNPGASHPTCRTFANLIQSREPHST